MSPAPRPAGLEDLNPFAPWGVSLSRRDGQPALTETILWTLELTHPEVVERDGGETYLHLDRTYRVVPQADRAWMRLEPAPDHQRREASPASSQ